MRNLYHVSYPYLHYFNDNLRVFGARLCALNSLKHYIFSQYHKSSFQAGHGDYNCSNVPSKQIPAQRDHIRVRLFQYVPHPKTTQPPAKPRHFKDQILYGFHDLLLEKTAASIFIRVGLASDRDDRDFIPSFRRCFVSVLNMCFKLAAVLHFT